jgi:DNA topoisomerase VI subunit A
MYCLIDFDPHGINIYRCYKEPSAHYQLAGLSRLRWLGVKSEDLSICRASLQNSQQSSQTYGSQQSQNSQTSAISASESGGYRGMTCLTEKDRRFTVNMLHKVRGRDNEMVNELQTLLFLNVKCEIQMLNESGDISGYLDYKLGGQLGDGLELKGKL